MITQKQWQCRIASSLGGGFEGTPNEVWGTKDYTNDTDPTVFFGLYGLPDFFALWRHKGRKAILWAGSDIRHLEGNYWLDETGEIRIDNKGICEWINKNCECYVENQVEHDMLKTLGIDSKIVPSFLGDVSKFTPQEIRTDKKRYYSSVSGDDFGLYGWDKIEKLAIQNKETEYHLYGNNKPNPFISFHEGEYKLPSNIIIHGRVPKEQMNEECKTMTGAIRMVKMEGFSEIIAKSILWGQKPISLIPYDYDRESLLKVLNKYPWNTMQD